MRKDTHHDLVVRALRRDGWHIADEQSPFTVEDRTVDIEAERADERLLIFVEVKGFHGDSQVTDRANALGQYLLYQHILEREYGATHPLYLAVPQAAYVGILSEELGVSLRTRYQVRPIVVDVQHEEISAWIT